MDRFAAVYDRFMSGDDEALIEIVQYHKDGLMLYLNGFVNNIPVAEELMEETFFRIITRRPVFRPVNSFKTWLYTIGRNVALDYLRCNRHHKEVSLEEAGQPEHEASDLERIFLREERKMAVHQAMKKIQPQYRQVLWLVYMEDFSNAEAAAIMKKNSRQVKNLIFRAKAALKAELEKEGFVYEEL